MTDNSLIRLLSDFNAAKRTLNPHLSQINYESHIVFRPDRIYRIQTNTPQGISFDGEYAAYLVDCNDVVLGEITNRVGIYGFVNSRSGLNQVEIEFAPLNVDFGYKPVFLRIEKPFTTIVWYSNPITVTAATPENYTELAFRGYGNIMGFDYLNASYMQIVGIRAAFDDIADESESAEYYQITREHDITARVLPREIDVYTFEPFASAWVVRKVNAIFRHPVVYVDGVRITNKPLITSDKRLGASNAKVSSFNVQKDEEDTYTTSLSIIQPLTLIETHPSGLYVPGTLPVQIEGTFNYDVTLQTGTVIVRDSEGNVLATYTQADIAFPYGANIFNIAAFEGLITDVGQYMWEISAGLFSSQMGENEFVVIPFEVRLGNYDREYYDNDYYFTN